MVELKEIKPKTLKHTCIFCGFTMLAVEPADHDFFHAHYAACTENPMRVVVQSFKRSTTKEGRAVDKAVEILEKALEWGITSKNFDGVKCMETTKRAKEFLEDR